MNKTFSLMGICRKAGKLLPGHDISFDAVRSGKAELVILASDASVRHEKELEALNYSGKTLRLNVTADEIAYAVGKKSCIFAVTDKGFAKALEKTICEEEIRFEYSNKV